MDDTEDQNMMARSLDAGMGGALEEDAPEQPDTDPYSEKHTQDASDIITGQVFGDLGMQDAYSPLQSAQPANAADTTGTPSYLLRDEAQQQVDYDAALQKASADKQAQMDDEQERAAQQNEAQDQQDEQRVAQDFQIHKQGSHWGSMIGQIVSILIGAKSQALTGSKTNPGLEAVEKAAAARAASLRYNEAQKAKLMEMMLKGAKQKLAEKQASTDSAYKQAIMRKLDSEIDLNISKVQQAKSLKGLMGKKEYTQEELYAMRGTPEGNELAGSMIMSPNGKYVLAKSKGAADDFDKIYGSSVPGVQQINRMINQVSDRDFMGRLSPEDRVRMGSEIKLIAGRLRIPILGPGQMTEGEYNRLLDTLGNPNGIQPDSWTVKKLQAVRDNLLYDLKYRYKAAGYDPGPLEQEKQDEQVDRLSKLGVTREQINAAREALKRRGN